MLPRPLWPKTPTSGAGGPKSLTLGGPSAHPRPDPNVITPHAAHAARLTTPPKYARNAAKRRTVRTARRNTRRVEQDLLPPQEKDGTSVPDPARPADVPSRASLTAEHGAQAAAAAATGGAPGSSREVALTTNQMDLSLPVQTRARKRQRISTGSAIEEEPAENPPALSPPEPQDTEIEDRRENEPQGSHEAPDDSYETVSESTRVSTLSSTRSSARLQGKSPTPTAVEAAQRVRRRSQIPTPSSSAKTPAKRIVSSTKLPRVTIHRGQSTPARARDPTDPPDSSSVVDNQ
ncbi:predicted protein [Aspergillus terreus NIH2624]|uniref:Uncharacterized protein n=1 Tax=Aspergillus terreus (strain NIH 2624 / FGSC A1156) TaxID=341663 RepID=Q0C9Z9_ASPTN|nr:uncharacterized protein ATEG_09485 [Aspergillus terreus NIH2624]EAU29676.1 predicted protein [Aspergillus terreus NIH2624]